MTPTGPIVVLGSANMDLVTRQPRLPAPGETIAGTGFATGAGGKGLNQAVAARRAGAEVTFAGAVGDDGFGRELRAFLEAEGIATAHLRTSAQPTGIAQVSVLADGENGIVIVAGANGEDELTDGDRAAIAGASALVVQLERPLALVERALSAARAAGVRTVLTPAPVDGAAARLLPLVDVLVPNEPEALGLSGAADVEGAARHLSERVGTVIVTRGPRGALVAREGGILATVEAVAVDAVDTTGAGDTFVGVLVARLVEGAVLDDAVRAATAAAAIAVTRPGAAPAMPYRAEIEAALARRVGTGGATRSTRS
ncbi:ribokinase [Myceligenerans pegani]|uniref:Ribokinase n=1 Tax=Myceligenerans pegani TaxID=2776917 RepID=A0ABR9N1X0_9MICO|nr:ribokinase [Myceligenerans sp. TRM 65318]MBE1877638.1 ribokinase [Myceligenerans sp. TRM 65318]MBE3019909.1 ribokinase [Myceligenerans sp. TRM 65318]